MSTSKVDVIVATFGEEKWRDLAQVAAESARTQSLPCEVHLVHGRTLAEARNLGAERSKAPYLLFLDADDVLRPEFIAKLNSAITEDVGVLLQSEVSFTKGGGAPGPPHFLRSRPILSGNYLIVGTAVARETFLRVGGFRELDLLEDWDLWIRCMAQGCRVRRVPGAVYEVRLRRGSRNDADMARMSKMIRELRARYWPAIYGGKYRPLLSSIRLLRDEVAWASGAHAAGE